MEVGAGGKVRNDQHIDTLRGDPEVEFAKAVLRAAGRYVDPHWTKKELLLQLQQLTQAAAVAAQIRTQAEEEAERQQMEEAARRAYRLGVAPTDVLPSESEHRL